MLWMILRCAGRMYQGPTAPVAPQAALAWDSQYLAWMPSHSGDSEAGGLDFALRGFPVAFSLGRD